MPPALAYIGLGSNLQQPKEQVARAIQELADLPDTHVTATSHWYRSNPIGPDEQPDYINGAALLTTYLQPLELLQALQEIENAHDRVREIRWGARTLDLDILLYGNLRIALPQLQVPHPQLANRHFVLRPLLDITPELTLPDGTSLQDLLAKLPTEGIVRIADN